MNQLRTDKALIRDFLKSHYSNTNLAEALDLARADRLFFDSCCCLVGIPNRNHAGFVRASGLRLSNHKYATFGASCSTTAPPAELAFLRLGRPRGRWTPDDDVIRCRLIVPILKAEIRRRIKLASIIESVGVEVAIDQELTKAQ